MRRRLPSVLAALGLLLSACSSGGSPVAPKAAAGASATGTIDVFAAASLTSAFTMAGAALTRAYPGLGVTYNFGGSNALVSQIQQGAPADVFASADTENMQKLVRAGLVEAPVTFARNRLEIAVAAGNPKRIGGLADLARPGTTVVMEATGVPAGDYTRRVLAAKGITLTPRSLETDVKSAVAKVASGEADATVVYETDVASAGSRVSGVALAAADQPSITYPIAIVKATKNHTAARAFVDSALSGDVQKALEAAGFLPAR